MIRVAVPAVVVMLAVALFVGAAGWNQSDEPWLVMTLTERELPLTNRPDAPGDAPAPRLRLEYVERHDPLDARNWLPETRLREIGFALHVPATAPQAVDAYDQVPPRLAWVVFEYDGPTGREIDRRRALLEPREPQRRSLRSRLVPVDAGAEFEALRVRYPTGHLIVRAIVGIAYVPADRGGPLLHGVLQAVVPPTLSVPAPLGELLGELSTSEETVEPRYEVELAVGQLGLPYVRRVAPLPHAPAR